MRDAKFEVGERVMIRISEIQLCTIIEDIIIINRDYLYIVDDCLFPEQNINSIMPDCD